MFLATAARVFAFGVGLGAAVIGFSSPSQAHPNRGGHYTGRSGFSHLGEPGGRPISFRSNGFNEFASGFGAFTFRSSSRPRAFVVRSGHSGGGIQCVTFARADSGIELSGNASAWWANAAGVYQRGARPEAGAVLNFRANGSMRMGHVAVVNQVMNSRTIDIDHANWGGPGAVRGGISRNIQVVDVSPANDWSAVRVALGHSSEFGSIYPTYGFIYDRPDAGVMVASNDRSAPVAGLNPAPRDLRRFNTEVVYDEVAEAPDTGEVTRSYSHNRHFTGHIHFARHASTRAVTRHHSHHRV